MTTKCVKHNFKSWLDSVLDFKQLYNLIPRACNLIELDLQKQFQFALQPAD